MTHDELGQLTDDAITSAIASLEACLGRLRAAAPLPDVFHDLAAVGRLADLTAFWLQTVLQSRLDGIPSMPNMHGVPGLTRQTDAGSRPADQGIYLPDLNVESGKKALVMEALKRSDGFHDPAASLLGITRHSLKRRIQEFELATEVEQIRLHALERRRSIPIDEIKRRKNERTRERRRKMQEKRTQGGG